MPGIEREDHLDVYENRYELHQGEETEVYYYKDRVLYEH